MATDRGKSPFRFYGPTEGAVYFAAFIGAGAAILTVPTAAQSVTIGLPLSANLAAPRGSTAAVVVTRTGVGDHTYTFATFASPGFALMVMPECDGPTDLAATIRSIAITNGALAIRVLTKTAAGVATDLPTTDTLRLAIFGSDSKAF